jgi:hypothetical protein
MQSRRTAEDEARRWNGRQRGDSRMYAVQKRDGYWTTRVVEGPADRAKRLADRAARDAEQQRQRARRQAQPLYLRAAYRFGQVMIVVGIVLLLIASAGIVSGDNDLNLYGDVSGYVGFVLGMAVAGLGEGLKRWTRL